MHQLQDFQIFEHMPFIVLIKDEQLNYVWVNQAWLQIANLTLDEVIGKSDHDLFPAEEAEAFIANDHNVLANDKPVTLQEQVTDADGNNVTSNVCKFTAEIDGKKCLVGIVIPQQ